MSTYLRLISSPSALAVVGGAWVLVFATTDASTGDPTGSVTPVVDVVDPSGVASAPSVMAGAQTGTWYAEVAVGAPGRWTATVSTPEDAVLAAVFVQDDTTEAGMPTVADCVSYLAGVASSWSQDQIEGAYRAERSAQRDRCGERNPYPDSLREALLRRVARNLAMRRLPLAVATGDADSGSSIIPGRDPEVRRLEGPYRRLVTG